MINLQIYIFIILNDSIILDLDVTIVNICSISGLDKTQGCSTASNLNPEDIENIKLDFTQFQKYE